MSACKPHGTLGDCGTCRLQEDLEKLRAFSLSTLDPACFDARVSKAPH